jgi:hypothetical protein
MGKSTMSMAIFNSFLYVYQRVSPKLRFWCYYFQTLKPKQPALGQALKVLWGIDQASSSPSKVAMGTPLHTLEVLMEKNIYKWGIFHCHV